MVVFVAGLAIALNYQNLFPAKGCCRHISGGKLQQHPRMTSEQCVAKPDPKRTFLSFDGDDPNCQLFTFDCQKEAVYVGKDRFMTYVTNLRNMDLCKKTKEEK